MLLRCARSGTVRTTIVRVRHFSSASDESKEVGKYERVISTVPPLKENFDMKNIALTAGRGGRSSISGIRATVFGASSITGHAVINQLGQIGSQVVVPYRGDGREVKRVRMMGDLGQIIPLPFHLRDARTVARAIEGSNMVINMIGVPRETWNFTYHDTHVNGAHLIAKTAMELGVSRFIQVSSLTAHPEARSEFDRTKWHGEQVVKQYFPEATILRPSLIYGHNDRFMWRMCRTWKKWAFKRPHVMNPHRVVNPVTVEDVALAVMRCVIDPIETAGKTYHLTGNVEATNEQWMYRVGEVLDMWDSAYLMDFHKYDPRLLLPFFKFIKEPQRRFIPPIVWNFFRNTWVTYDELERSLTDAIMPEVDEYGNVPLTHEDLGIIPRDYFDREVILCEPFHPMDYWTHDGQDWYR